MPALCESRARALSLTHSLSYAHTHTQTDTHTQQKDMWTQTLTECMSRARAPLSLSLSRFFFSLSLVRFRALFLSLPRSLSLPPSLPPSPSPSLPPSLPLSLPFSLPLPPSLLQVQARRHYDAGIRFQRRTCSLARLLARYGRGDGRSWFPPPSHFLLPTNPDPLPPCPLLAFEPCCLHSPLPRRGKEGRRGWVRAVVCVCVRERERGQCARAIWCHSYEYGERVCCLLVLNSVASTP